MKISDDRFKYVVSFNLIVFSIGLIWRILIEFFDIFSNPERETIFLKVGGVSIVIGLLLAIPLVRLDIKGENLDLKKQFWHVFAINNFFLVWGNCLDIIFDEVIRLILDHFIQPDAIVPSMFNPQNLSRYSYVRNNPILYTDPSGHAICLDGIYCRTPTNPSYQNYAPPSSTTGGQHHEETYNPENLGGNGDVPAQDGIVNGKGPGLNASAGNQTPGCHNFSGGGYACKLSITEDNIKAFENYHTQFRIGVRVLYYGATVLVPTLVALGVTRISQVSLAVGAFMTIAAIVGDEHIVQPGLREVDNVHQQFKNAINYGEIIIGRVPDSNNRIVGDLNEYIEVDTVIGKAYVDLMMVLSQMNTWNR